MTRMIVIYGTIGGLIVGMLMALTIPLVRDTSGEAYGMAIGYTTMLIALSTIFVAIKRRRDRDQGGVIGFWPAFAMGLGISIIAGLFYVAAWEIMLKTMHGDFIGEMIASSIADQKAKGVSGAKLAAYVTQMNQFARDYANPFYRMPVTFTEIFPVGVLVSFVSAALLRNSRFLPARRPAPGMRSPEAG